MPSDIRSFFGGKGGGASSQESSQPAKKTESTQGRRAKIRKVIDDSDDEQIPEPKTKTTPKKSKSTKKESPKGEETTASSYFASISNGKQPRSTPSKSRVVVTRTAPPKSSDSPLTPAKAKVEKENESSVSASKSRSSGRKRKANAYAEDDDDEEEDDYVAKMPSEDSGSDIFQAGYKTGKQMDDGYDEGSDDEVVVTKSRRKTTKKSGGAEADQRLPVKSVNGAKTPSVASSRKRKSMSSEDEFIISDDDEDTKPSKKGGKRAASSKKPAVKKPRATKSGEPKARKPPKSKEVKPESSEMQAIFDGIPTVAPPSPPQAAEDGKHKFKFGGHQNSGPAPAAGSKEIPTGQENCLAGLNFVFTGLLEALSREEGQNLVKRYGGRVLGQPSGKTSYVVLGSDAGPKKLETIAKYNIKTINEDGLFALISRLPANGGDGNAAAAHEEKKKKDEENIKKMAAEMEAAEKQRLKAMATKTKNAPTPNLPTKDSRLWTVKYSPTSTAQICGNKGVVEKLQKWLRAWPDNFHKGFKHAGPDGSFKFRAVIIHGPPGVGKTTAAHLVANLEGYDVLESNASDTRSKKLVETGLRGVLDNTSLLGYFAGDDKKVEAKKKKIVLVMDEVDGMSAGDRGGVGALAQVCKKTSIPMILICNDRRLPKMKPFDFVAFDLPFRRPTTQDIRSRITTICFREGLKLPGPVIDALIEGSKADIRQIINMISTIKLDDASLDFNQTKSMSKAWEKHVILKPWDVVQQLLSGGMFHATSTKTLNDKIELYFNDHELSFLMLQENYLKSTPTALGPYKGKERSLKALELADNAAESISDGDLVDRMIHGPQQQWSLMPTHAVFSTVRPASFVAGTMVGSGGPKFPAWLGNNSKQTKLFRFVKEIQGHMRLRSSGDRHEIRQQYLPTLWYSLIKRLVVEGKEVVEEVIDLMDSYFLTKEDWDAVLELGVGPMDQDSIKIETQTKAAFTRLYNQRTHPMPFMKASNVVAPSKATKSKPDLEEAIEESEGEEAVLEKADEDEDDVDISKDKYIKQPKKKAAGTKADTKKQTQKKGKSKVESNEDESDSEDKPKKGRAAAKKGSAAGKGKVKR